MFGKHTGYLSKEGVEAEASKASKHLKHLSMDGMEPDMDRPRCIQT